MALIKCSGCGQMMSDKAEVCPNCGYQIGEKQKSNGVGSNTKSPNKILQYIILGVIAIAVAGAGYYYFIKDKTLFKATLEINDDLIKTVDGHYAIILYNDNTGEFYHPNGGRICSVKLTDGRSEPLKMRLSSSLYILGKSTDRLILTYDRLFSDYSDYLKYTSNYNPDKNLGTPVEKREGEDRVTYIVTLNENQIEQKNVSKLSFKLKKGCDFFIMSYNDEYGVLLGADGKRICGTEKEITTAADVRFKLSNAVPMYGETMKELYIKGDRMYATSDELIEDIYTKTGEPSRSKANVLSMEEKSVTIYSLYSRDPSLDGESRLENAIESNANKSVKTSDWDITSVEELERKIVGTVWTCRPTGRMWYRLVFSESDMTLYYAQPSQGKWNAKQSDKWRWNATQSYTSDTGEKCYTIQFKKPDDELSYGALLFFKDGEIQFNWLRGREGGKAECKDFNWE